MRPNDKYWLFELTLEDAYNAYNNDGIYFELGHSSLLLPTPFDDTNMFVMTRSEK